MGKRRRGVSFGVVIVAGMGLFAFAKMGQIQADSIPVTLNAVNIVVHNRHFARRGADLFNGNADIPADFTYGGTTYIPIRLFAQTLGYSVQWNAQTQSASLTVDTASVTPSIGPSVPQGVSGARQIPVSRSPVQLLVHGTANTPPNAMFGNVPIDFITHGTTYMPIRFVTHALGLPVSWDAATGTILVGGSPSAPPSPTSIAINVPVVDIPVTNPFGTFVSRQSQPETVNLPANLKGHVALYTIGNHQDGPIAVLGPKGLQGSANQGVDGTESVTLTSASGQATLQVLLVPACVSCLDSRALLVPGYTPYHPGGGSNPANAAAAEDRKYPIRKTGSNWVLYSSGVRNGKVTTGFAEVGLPDGSEYYDVSLTAPAAEAPIAQATATYAKRFVRHLGPL